MVATRERSPFRMAGEGERPETKKAHLSMSPSFACLRGEAFTNKSQSE